MQQGLSYEIASVIGEAYDTGLFTSLFTAQQPSGNLGPSGAPDGTWVAIAGLSNIPCMNAPVSETRIEATDVKSLQEILSTQVRHVLLYGYYPSLATGSENNWNALIDGVAWDILGAEPDSQKTMTRAHVRIAEI